MVKENYKVEGQFAAFNFTPEMWEKARKRMAPEIKQVTVREAFEALAKNGFDHLRNSWVTTNPDGTVLGGCALGQSAVNLGVNTSNGIYSLYGQLNRFRVRREDIKQNVIRENVGYEYGLAALIIDLNDSRRNEDSPYRYSWKYIVQQAQKYMTPFFDEVLELQVYHFSVGV